MPFALSGVVRLYYEEVGSGEPLILISGQGSDHTTWDPVREDFAVRHRVVTFDHRGTGQSDAPTEPAYTIQGFARDAVAVLDHLGIARAHAYGVSMGGRTCPWLAIEHSTRIGALVLGCTTPGNTHGVRRPPEVDARMANRPADPEESLAFMAERMVSPDFLDANPWYLELRRRRALNPIPAHAQKMHYRASEGHDSWDRLPEIMAPTLVIHGTEDFVNPSGNAALLAGRIPGAELYMVSGGRHGYFLEFRDECTPLVLDFLARHPLS